MPPTDILHHADVVLRCQRRKQIVLLKYEPDGGLAKISSLSVGHTCQIPPVDLYGSGAHWRQAPKNMEERRLSRARSSDNRYKFALPYFEIHPTQRMHRNI